MAQFENIFYVDLKKPNAPMPLRQVVGEGDSNGFKVGAVVTSDGETVSLGGSCVGKVVRADGATVQLTGTISGNTAYVVLDQQSCAIEGPIQVAVCWVSSSNVTTLLVAYGTVINTQTGTAIQPSTPIPDLTQLLAEISAMETATAAANAAAASALTNFAGAFSASTAYTAGQYVTYTDGKFYRFTTNHAAGAWNSAHVVAVTAGGELADLKSAFNTMVDDTMELTTGANKCPSNFFDGYLESNGSVTPYSDWKTTDFIDVTSDTAFNMTAAKTDNTRTSITGYFFTTYNSSKTLIEQIGNVTSPYTVGTGVTYVRFSFHGDTYHNIMVGGATNPVPYEPYKVTYTAVNDSYALQSDMVSVQENVTELQTAVSAIAEKDYQLYTPTFSLNPSAIENDGNLIDTLTGTKTTDYIDCSGWVGIRYTGSSWLVCRALAFYDASHTWILSYPATGDTTEYTNEIINIPSNAKYVIFADLTAKQAQTLRIEVATSYKTAGKWEGKKWTCVGDSLTESNLRTTMNYHDYVAQSTGLTVVNMGRSGTGYMRTYDEGYAFYQRISSVPTDSDVVTIFGSGNDLLYIDNLGSPTDSGAATNPTTICGCINKTIDTLIGIKPNVQLGIVAPTPWQNEKPTLDNSNPMGRYVEALRQICYIRSIPFLDLYHESNLRPWTAEGRAACYSKDDGGGTHPDEAGHKIIASRFEGFLDSLLLD